MVHGPHSEKFRWVTGAAISSLTSMSPVRNLKKQMAILKGNITPGMQLFGVHYLL